MKKINQKGFVLAETLVVAIFLMAIFTLIFSNFYPLIGEYEKRETFDDVDGKYAVYWIRKIIEDSSYKLSENEKSFFQDHGYVRFRCSDLDDQEKREICVNLVKELETKSCNSTSDTCEIYITRYQLTTFKEEVKGKITRKEVNNSNKTAFVEECEKGLTAENAEDLCKEEADRREFRSGFREYVDSLPDYKKEALDGSRYRVIACFQHKRGSNNYYSYSTMEVSR